MNFPFTSLEHAGDRSHVIPLENLQKNTGEESSSLLLVRESGTMHLFTKSQAGTWNVHAVHNSDEYDTMRQIIDGNLLLALNELRSGDVSDKRNENLYTYIQKAYDHYLLANIGHGFHDFEQYVKKHLTNLGTDVEFINNKQRELSFELQKILTLPETQQKLEELRNNKAISIRHIDKNNICSGENNKVIAAACAALNLIGSALDDTEVFPHATSVENDNLNTVSATPMGQLCQDLYLKSYIEAMDREEGDEAAAKIGGDLASNHNKYRDEAQKALHAYKNILIPINFSNGINFENQIKCLQDYQQRFGALGQQVKFQAEKTEQELIEVLQNSSLNTDNITIARNLWADNKYPNSCDPNTVRGLQNKTVYDTLMSNLSQLNRASDRLHAFKQKFERLKYNLEHLDEIKGNLSPEIYTNYAKQANASLAELTSNIRRFKEKVNRSFDLSVNQRKMDLYAEARSIQWREHQEEKIPEIMDQLSSAIKANKSERIFVKWGAGSGKSVFMVLACDGAHKAISKEEKTRRNVLCFAPRLNLNQLKGPIESHFLSKEKIVQEIDIISMAKLDKNWWQNETNLDNLLFKLMGISEKTPKENQEINKALDDNGICMLSHADALTLLALEENVLQMNSESVNENSEPPISQNIVQKIQAICDFMRSSITLGDECTAGCMPYTNTALDDIKEQLIESLRSFKNIQDLEVPDIGRLFAGFIASSQNFVGFSATSGSPAISAVLSGESDPDKISKAMNEDLATTRARLLDRLGKIDIIITDKSGDNAKLDAMKKIVAKNGANHGYCVLDTSVEGKNQEISTAQHWHTYLKQARTACGDKKDYAMQWIDSSGKTNLYDKTNQKYKTNNRNSFGTYLEKGDEDFDLLRRDGVLTRDQGVGSDMGSLTQELQTHAVMFGVLGNQSYGNFDAFEQWEARGDRANCEPYSSQKVSMIITNEEIQQVAKKNPQWKSFLPLQNKVKENEKALDDKISQFKNSNLSRYNKLLQLKNTPISIKGNSSDEMTPELYKNKYEHALNELKVVWTNEFDEGIANALYFYHQTREEAQLLIKTLFVDEIAVRSFNDYVAASEEGVFTGSKQGAIKKLFTDEHQLVKKNITEIRNQKLLTLQENLTEKLSLTDLREISKDLKKTLKNAYKNFGELVQMTQEEILEIEQKNELDTVLFKALKNQTTADRNKILTAFDQLQEALANYHANKAMIKSVEEGTKQKLANMFDAIINITPRGIYNDNLTEKAVSEVIANSTVIKETSNHFKQAKKLIQEAQTPDNTMVTVQRSQVHLNKTKEVMARYALQNIENMKESLKAFQQAYEKIFKGNNSTYPPNVIFRKKYGEISEKLTQTEKLIKEQGNNTDALLTIPAKLAEIHKEGRDAIEGIEIHSTYKKLYYFKDLYDPLLKFLGVEENYCLVNSKMDNVMYVVDVPREERLVTGAPKNKVIRYAIKTETCLQAGCDPTYRNIAFSIPKYRTDEAIKPYFIDELEHLSKTVTSGEESLNKLLNKGQQIKKIAVKILDESRKELNEDSWNRHLITKGQEFDRLIADQNELRIYPDNNFKG